MSSKVVSVLCVEDNPEVAEALATKLSRISGLSWVGSLPSADALVERVRAEAPGIVLLDVDMPGGDPFEALSEMARVCPDCRAILFTGHVRRELIERALEAGAWGYVSKNDGEEELVAALQKVAGGEFALGPEARRLYDSK